ncbi:MAG: hypothetical protein ACRDKX_10105, partial [Solirubrobacterales bacterium]
MWHNARIFRNKFYLRFVSVILILSTVFGLPTQPGLADERTLDNKSALHDNVVQAIADAAGQTQDGTTIHGVLLSVSLLGLLQIWVIETGDGETQSVNVGLDLLGLLGGNAPPVGSWVAADVEVQLGNLVALRVRLDDYEPGQIVARLISGVSPETVAQRYDLVQEDILLSSG